jgi:hypothetical protein
MGKSCDRRVEQDRALGSAHAKMNTMQYYNTSFVRIASANLLGILTALGLNGAVLAAGTCIEGPKAGGHWDYRVDPVNHRKCWYVTGTGLKTQEGAPLQPSPTSTPNSTLLSWFASLSTGPPGSVRRAGNQAPHENQASRRPLLAKPFKLFTRSRRSGCVPPVASKQKAQPPRKEINNPRLARQQNMRSRSTRSRLIRPHRTLCSLNFCDGRNFRRA